MKEPLFYTGVLVEKNAVMYSEQYTIRRQCEYYVMNIARNVIHFRFFLSRKKQILYNIADRRCVMGKNGFFNCNFIFQLLSNSIKNLFYAKKMGNGFSEKENQ